MTTEILGNSNSTYCINIHLCSCRYLLVIRANGVSLSGLRLANSTNIEGAAAVLVEGGDFIMCNCVVSDFYQVAINCK